MQKQRETYQPTGNWRHNPLSKVAGGSTVIVYYLDYNVEYNNIKNVAAYVDKILSADTVNQITHIQVKETGTVFNVKSKTWTWPNKNQ